MTYCMQECLYRSMKKKLWNRSKSKRLNCVSQAVMFLRFCQQAMERVEFIKVFLAKLFASNPNANVSVISRLINTLSTASPENNSEI